MQQTACLHILPLSCVYPPDSQFRERLQSVLDSLSDTRQRGSTSPFSQLDALYVHIVKQIPESILLLAQLLLFCLSF